MIIYLFISVVFAIAQKENGVLVFTDSNFDEEIANYEYLLVEFYAPWCGHCKKLAPEYEEAAKTLDLAKVDATLNKALAERFEIKGFPTLLFFKNGKPTKYDGPRDAYGIVKWVNKKSNPPSKKVECSEIESLAEASEFVLAYFGNVDHDQYKQAHVEYALSHDHMEFVHLDDEECAQTYGVQKLPAFVFFRKFEERTMVFNGFENSDKKLTDLENFMGNVILPTVFELNEETFDKFLNLKRPTLILFRNDGLHHDAPFMNTYRMSAHQLKGKILFAYGDIAIGIQERLASFLGVKDEDLPTLRAFFPEGQRKYECETPVEKLTQEEIDKFIEGLYHGQIKPKFKSDPVPTSQGPVIQVVGKTFEQIVMDPTKDVLVKFYAPWCGHCKKLAEPWEELAVSMKEYKNLVIAKFDATSNEADGVQIRGYPTIMFYPRDFKQGVKYEGDRTVEMFKEYLKDTAPTVREQDDGKYDRKDDL